jgi:multiple sugar transport system permease protein
MQGTQRSAAIFTLPLAVALLALLIYPLASTLIDAFRTPDGSFGFGNFVDTVTEAGFPTVALNTLIFTLASTGLSFALGFSMAYAMDFVEAGRRWLVSVFMLPLAIMPVVSGLTFGMMLNPALGVVNQLLAMIGVAGPGWATTTGTALITVILIDVWQWTPFCFVIIHAGFRSLSREHHEAATVDGASAMQELLFISIPMLKSILLITAIFRFMEAFKAFDTIYVVTQGGPGRATETLIVRAFMEGFRFYKPHTMAVIGLVLLVVTAISARLVGRLLVAKDTARS